MVIGSIRQVFLRVDPYALIEGLGERVQMPGQAVALLQEKTPLPAFRGYLIERDIPKLLVLRREKLRRDEKDGSN